MTKALTFKEKKIGFTDDLNKMNKAIAQALPKHIDEGVFARTVLTTITKNPKLLDCTRASLFGAILQSAQLGLVPDGLLGHAYLIPYGKECNFQTGYKGIIQLVRRTNKVQNVIAQPVYKGDVFIYDLSVGIQEHKRGEDVVTEDKNITHFYAKITYNNGGSDFAIMTKEQVDRHMKRYSKSWRKKDSAWQTDFVAMGKKTVILQAAKFAELSTEVQTAVALEETSDGHQRNSALTVDLGDEFIEANQQEVEDIEHKEMEDKKEQAKTEQKEKAQKATEQLNVDKSGQIGMS